jgi:hypothetical protein
MGWLQSFSKRLTLLPDGDEGITVPLLRTGSAQDSCNPSCSMVTSLEASFTGSPNCFIQLSSVQAGPAHRSVGPLVEEQHDGVVVMYVS